MRLTWLPPWRRRWRHSLISGLAALALSGGAAVAEGPRADGNPVDAIGDQPIEVSGAEGSGTLLAFSSRPLLGRMAGVTRLVIMVHGGARDADRAEAVALAAIGPAAGETLVVAPQFLNDIDARRWTLPGDRLRWSEGAWVRGLAAAAPAPISPFTALDSLIHGLADPSLLPDLKTVTIAGHRAGADLVQRYAAVTTQLAGLDARGIAVRFVLAQPDSYLYVDQARPAPTDACPGFDDWPYGLDGAPSYLGRLGPASVFGQYRARHVVYLLGKLAVQEPDLSCAAAVQGADPPARGRAYLGYLAALANEPVHRLAEIPDAADARSFFTSACGVAALLDKPDCPALTKSPVVPPFALPAAPAPAEPPAKPDAPPASPSPSAPSLPVPPSPPPVEAAAPPPEAPPESVAPGGLADPLHEANPLAPVLTRPPQKPPAQPPPPQ
jgi:hypothetical protein